MAITHFIRPVSIQGVPNGVLQMVFGDGDDEILVTERRLARSNEYATVNRFGGYPRRVLTAKSDELTLRGSYNLELWASSQRTQGDKGLDAFTPLAYYLSESTIVRYGARRNRRRSTGVADGDFQLYDFENARWLVTALEVDDRDPYSQIFQQRQWQTTLTRVE